MDSTKSILLVNQFYWPDMAATAQLLADLAESLVAAGHDATVLAGRGAYAIEGRARLKRRERRRGVEVRRLWCTSFGRGHILARASDYSSFLLSASLATVARKRFDTVVCLSTPPLVALVGLIARARGSIFVYKVEDLYPDVAIALGALRKDSLLARTLARLSAAVLSRADVVVALDSAMKREILDRGARRVEVIPNWTDGAEVFPDPEAGAAFREQHGLEGRFVVLYSGNMGMAHRFDAVAEAARRLAASDPDVAFLFVGSGARQSELREATASLPNVSFLPYQARTDLRGLFNAADIHLVTLRDKAAGLLVPSKYSSALAVGKPVLLVGGEGADLHHEIARERVGWVCGHDSVAISAAIAKAAADTADTAAIGLCGRSLFTAKYDRSVAVGSWLDLLTEDLAAPRRPDART